MLVSSADNCCKQFRSILGWHGFGSKLFDTLIVLLKDFYEKELQMTIKHAKLCSVQGDKAESLTLVLLGLDLSCLKKHCRSRLFSTLRPNKIK